MDSENLPVLWTFTQISVINQVATQYLTPGFTKVTKPFRFKKCFNMASTDEHTNFLFNLILNYHSVGYVTMYIYIFGSLFFQTHWNTQIHSLFVFLSSDPLSPNIITRASIHEQILVLRVAPSNKILRKFLEMWAFPLKIKEKILVKKKVIQKPS